MIPESESWFCHFKNQTNHSQTLLHICYSLSLAANFVATALTADVTMTRRQSLVTHIFNCVIRFEFGMLLNYKTNLVLTIVLSLKLN